MALKRDFSNIAEVLEKLRDETFLCAMVDRTYEYILSCHTYRHRIEHILRAVTG